MCLPEVIQGTDDPGESQHLSPIPKYRADGVFGRLLKMEVIKDGMHDKIEIERRVAEPIASNPCSLLARKIP